MISKTFTAGADSFLASLNESFALYFLAGNDRLITNAGTTIAYMGAGDDVATVEAGSARVWGGHGADRFEVYGGSTRISGGVGDDLFNIRGGHDHVFSGREGNDRFNFLSDVENVRLLGDEGNDTFVANSRSISGS